VHTSRQLTNGTFAITAGGAPASVFDLFPDFDRSDRLGIVVGGPHRLVGASLLVLAAVHRFYELKRQLADEFWIYPDYFAFHVEGPHGHHGAVDIWPPHKEVVVGASGTELLQAINDRAITRLVVEEDGRDPGELQAEAVASARSRLRSAYAYSPRGRVADPDVEIAGDRVTDGYVASILDPRALLARLGDSPHAITVEEHIDEVAQDVRDRIAADRRTLVRAGRTVESYRRIPVAEAMQRLLPAPPTAA
jgi:hypothetical protein